jgi:hypothetical protein
MIDEDVAPIYQIENNLLNRRSFGHSVGYGRHEIKLSKKVAFYNIQIFIVC